MKKNDLNLLGYLSPEIIASGIIALLLSYSTSVSAEPDWTLQSSINRVLKVAPESQAALEMIGMRKMEKEQSGYWPNPEIEIRADEAIGLDDGSGGYDLTELVISQPIPINRLQYQGIHADAMLSATYSKNQQQQLILEHKTAMLFHQLQLETALYELSLQRLKMADQFSGSKKTGKQRKDNLVRYLSPLERQRLAILRETARQASNSAEGELNEVASQFRILLNLDQLTLPDVQELSVQAQTFEIEQLQLQLAQHPLLKSAQYAVSAANAEIDLARSSRYKDPTVNLFIERDNFNTQRETYSGVSVNMEIPLWNENKQAMSTARGNLINSKTEFEMQRRELSSELQQSYIHYAHLLEQTKDYKSRLLKPAEEMFKLSRKSFTAGEQNILGLIDSHNSYFEIKSGYLKLLTSIGYELASLRLAAGLSVSGSVAYIKNVSLQKKQGGKI